MGTFITTWRAFGFRAALRSTLWRLHYSRGSRRALAEIARREIAKRAAPATPARRTEPCEHCGGQGWYPYQPEHGDAYDALCWACGGSGRQPAGMRESEA